MFPTYPILVCGIKPLILSDDDEEEGGILTTKLLAPILDSFTKISK